ncbi:Uncharacterized conserved protein YecE, DUF72 family [Granulicella rosea]|uniref:Uncharacterized conserved protein YecE, DUF72 family n=1 Tax=Granulicella rosea TaxID=474952 RepID=A0A239CV81_9BACT|nr:DUF72 domain-containing protein [Granulicella rosea]SNS24136.1 Uncharacterized conserved protein YecE, DUF72 family [Granulicella rosea]
MPVSSAAKKPEPASLPPAAPDGLFAGTSGWAYATWKPGFYPANVSSKKFLSFYASQMNSVEVNYTFRALPTPKMLAEWLAATGEGFRFSFKAPQRITHFSRLRDCEGQVTDLLTALQPVGDAGRLGPLLFQLPPNFKLDLDRLRGFLSISALKEKKIAFEFRHESWFAPEVFALMTEFGAALCIAESDDLASPEVHTAPAHTCFRLRRNGGYTDAELAEFVAKFADLTDAGREVYAYFKHEDEPTGALNGAALLRMAVAAG